MSGDRMFYVTLILITMLICGTIVDVYKPSQQTKECTTNEN